MDYRVYLRDRLRKLEGLYRDRWPRWTNADFVAVSLLLDEGGLTPAAPDAKGDNVSALDHYSTARLQCIRDDALHTGDTELAEACEKVIAERAATEQAVAPDPPLAVEGAEDSDKSAGG